MNIVIVRRRVLTLLLVLAYSVVQARLESVTTPTKMKAKTTIAAASAANDNGNGHSYSLSDELIRRLQDLFDRPEQLPLRLQRDGITVRTAWEGNRVVTICECRHTPHKPTAFVPFLTRFNEAFPVVNKMTAWVESLIHESEREGIKSLVNMPFPLHNRLVVHWKYLKLGWNGDPDEHLLLISEQDNKVLLRNHVSRNELDKFVLGRTHLCAFWIRPVRDHATNRVIGSMVRYAFSGDAGGCVPKFVQELMGPKSAHDSVVGLLSFVQQQEQQQEQQKDAQGS